MPQVIVPFVASALTAAGVTGTISIAGSTIAIATLAANALVAAASFAVQAGVSSIQQREAKRRARRTQTGQEAQQSIRGSVTARMRWYGRNKVGGFIAFIENIGSDVYMIVAIGTGTIKSINQFYIGDKAVLLDADGNITNAPFWIGASSNPDARSYVRLQSRRGYVSQDAFSLITAAFPGKFTAAHRLNGIACVAARYRAVSAASFAKVYNSTIPDIRVTGEFSLVWDMRDAVQSATAPDTWTFSTNSALIAHDYLINRDGAALSPVIIASDTFAAAANACDEFVPLKSGGSERRYQASGGYSFDEQPEQVMQRITDTCGGEFFLRADGKIGFRVAKWVEPTVTMTDSDIVTMSVDRGIGLLSQSNALRPIYTSEQHGWQEIEAPIVEDADAVEEMGRVVADKAEYPWVHSAAQAQRLAKIELHRENPNRSGEMTCHLTALVLSDYETNPFFKIVSARYGLEIVARVTSMRPNEDFSQLVIGFSEVRRDAFEWDPAEEEGDAPAIPPDTGDDSGNPAAPNSFAFSTETVASVSVTGVRWACTERAGQVFDFRWRPVGGVWVQQDGLTRKAASISGVTLGSDYDVEARVRTAQGGISPWGSASFTAANHGATDLAAPTSLAAAGGQESISITAIQSVSAAAWAIQYSVYPVGGAASFSSANEIVAAPGVSATVSVSAAVGDWRVKVRAVSIQRAVVSPETAYVAVTVAEVPPTTGGGGGSGGDGSGGPGSGNTGGSSPGDGSPGAGVGGGTGGLY